MYVRDVFRKANFIRPEILASTSAGSLSEVTSTNLKLDGNALGANFDISIQATTGNVTIGFSTTLTSTNGFIIPEGLCIDITVESKIYLVGNSTTAKYQVIGWDA